MSSKKCTVRNLTLRKIMCSASSFEEKRRHVNHDDHTLLSADLIFLLLFFFQQGCLAPVEIRIPPGSLLNPSPKAAVVGGNVLTSQRVTDVILRCFRACAASQGCMNNLTFGDENMG